MYFPTLIYLAKSTLGTTRLSAAARKLITIPQHVFNCLVGLILSDLCVSRRTPSSNARLSFGQSGKLAKSEFFWLVFNLLSIFCTPGLVPHIKTWVDKRHPDSEPYTSINFVTMQLPCFNVLHDLFYAIVGLNSNGLPIYQKIVPANIMELLTPAGLAYWIMGDGSKQNNGITLSVYGFTLAEVNLLVNALTQKFGLTCTIHNHEKGPRIYIDAASTLIVRELVRPYMVPSMMYKLGL